ncbi:MAG: DNA-3-methyladenine glycosylase I [Salinivirgaceae bacterium]|jgi:DNA-3-methyladenine glycosylase I|nr:DNA-3-methyladenine glycosylase I [Salinivirgaceae bacterium]
MDKHRCKWAHNQPNDYIKYHDEEWGVPVYNDTKLFEFLVLEGAQAGLSWYTILKRREGYRKAFANFDVEKVAKFSDKKVEELMHNESIIRNRLKINATIRNARVFMEIQKEFGSFSKYMWSFTHGKPIKNSFKTMNEIPAETELSKQISKDLKKRGMSFVGPTIIYAHMQATGMVNDHEVECFRYKEV